MATEQLIYPKGRIAMDSGDLIDVTNVKSTTTNNGKQVHTIRRRGAGVTLGTEETTVSFDAAISEEGLEREYFSMVKAGTIKQLRLKLPGGQTVNVEGIYKTIDFELPLDAEVKLSMEFIGHVTD